MTKFSNKYIDKDPEKAERLSLAFRHTKRIFPTTKLGEKAYKKKNREVLTVRIHAEFFSGYIS